MKMTESQKAKKEAQVRKIIGEGVFPEEAKILLNDTYQNFLDVKPLKAAKKELTRQLKAIDKAIAILTPPKAE